MGRKINGFAACLLAGIMAAMTMLTVFAADSSVSYEGGAEKFVFVPGDGNLFPDFTGVMPGDSLSQRITVRNLADASGGVNLYLRAAGTDETTEGFLKQLTLTVRLGGQVLWEDAADKAGGITENTFLGSFAGGEEISLEVILTVPIEMDNRFQDAAGKLTWVFTAEEMDSPLDPPGGGGGDGSGDSGNLPGGEKDIEGRDGLTADGKNLSEFAGEPTPLAGILPEGISEQMTEEILNLLVPLGLLPETGDVAGLGSWMALVSFVCCGLAALFLVIKKHNRY